MKNNREKIYFYRVEAGRELGYERQVKALVRQIDIETGLAVSSVNCLTLFPWVDIFHTQTCFISVCVCLYRTDSYEQPRETHSDTAILMLFCYTEHHKTPNVTLL